MPELPELEALVETIGPPLTASPIARTPRAHFAVLKTGAPPLDALTGRTFTAARRRGKHLLFEAGDLTLAVHLMTMGRIGWYPPDAAKRPKAPVLEVHTDDGGALLATEGGTRKSMRVGLYDAAGIEGLTGHLGPEPLDGAFDLAALHAVLDHGSRQLNALLRDGREIAGIGRAFADEILHAAQLSPFQLTTRLDEEGRERLYAALKDVLRRGVEECRARQGAVLPLKNDGRLLRIHGHDGEPCPRCGQTLRFVDFEANRIVYCPHCQTGGKVLADRRMSRLLR
jgi:formamidopyrimidine-DNA glycosylase